MKQTAPAQRNFASSEMVVVFTIPTLHHPAGRSNCRMSAFFHPVISLCRVLDRLRARFLRLLGSPGRLLVRRRDLRVGAFGCTVMVLALAGSVWLPLWLLALGPVILGTPHVLSDVRYLVMRPGYHRRRRFWVPVGVPLLVAGLGIWPMEFGFGAVAAAAVLCDGRFVRKAVVLAVTAGLLAASVAAGDVARIVFAHVHNFVALALWWYWRPRSHWSARLIPVLFVGVVTALSAGWVAPQTETWTWFPGQVDFAAHAEALAPGLSLQWAGRLVLLFAFAQAVHYGIWLRLIPEDDRPGETPRTFGATYRALESDVGRAVLWGTFMVASGVAVWAVLDLAAARIGYLRMALFHGYLELIAAALLFIEGRRAVAAPSS